MTFKIINKLKFKNNYLKYNVNNKLKFKNNYLKFISLFFFLSLVKEFECLGTSFPSLWSIFEDFECTHRNDAVVLAKGPKCPPQPHSDFLRVNFAG